MQLSTIKTYPAPARMGLFVVNLLLLWLPFALPIYLCLGSKDPNLTTILTMGILFIIFLFVVRIWGVQVYQVNLFREYGLSTTRNNRIELLNGLAIGFSSCWVLFILQALMGWLEFTGNHEFLVKVILEGLVSAFGIGLAEELLFRGWLWDELRRDYNDNTATWSAAFLFAFLHFLKPLPEVIRTFPAFPALFMLGLTLIWAKKKCQQRLGMCIGLHAGLVWAYYIINVGQLVHYTDRVSPWITGVDGNPIAGIMGWLAMGILGWWISRK